MRRFRRPLSDKSAPHTGKDDATLDMYRWGDVQAGVQILRDRDIADHHMSAAAPIVVPGAGTFTG